MDHLYHGYVSHNQRVQENPLFFHEKNDGFRVRFSPRNQSIEKRKPRRSLGHRNDDL